MEDEDEFEEEDQELDSRAQRLNDRMRLSCFAIAEAEAVKHQMEVSAPVMSALADLTLSYSQQLGKELEMFAHHAGRKIVHVDDVVLAARRNEDVATPLKSLAQELKEQQQLEKKRKKPAGTGKQRIEIVD